MLRIKEDKRNPMILRGLGFEEYFGCWKCGKVEINSKWNIKIIREGSPYKVDVLFNLFKLDMVEQVYQA